MPPHIWRVETLLRGLSVLLACMLVGGVINGLVTGEDWGWVRFLIGTLSFHAAALVVVQGMLWEERSGWRLAFGLGHGCWWKVACVGGLVGLMVLPLAWLASWMTAEFMRWIFLEPEAQLAVETLSQTNHWWEYAAMGLMAVGVAPLAEEVVFRGLLYPFLKQRIRPEWAVAISSLLFGAIHFNLMTLPPLIFLALILVWLYESTGNLLAPVVAHAVFNLANLLLLLTL